MWCPFSWIYSHSSSIRLWDLGLLSVLMFFVQNLVYGIENWPWAWPSQPSSDVTVESLPLAGSSSRDLGAQHREPHGCGSRNHCCISGAEESQWHLQTQKLPLLIGRMHRQCFQVIQVAEYFSFGNFAELPHPVSGIFFFFFSPHGCSELKKKTPEAVYNDCMWIICLFCCAEVQRWIWAPWLKIISQNEHCRPFFKGMQRYVGDTQRKRWTLKGT